jgi:hypothetical protein
MAALKLTILVILLLASTTYGLNYDDVVQYFEREMFRIAQPTKLGAFYPNTFDLRVYYPQCNFTVYEEVNHHSKSSILGIMRCSLGNCRGRYYF